MGLFGDSGSKEIKEGLSGIRSTTGLFSNLGQDATWGQGEYKRQFLNPEQSTFGQTQQGLLNSGMAQTQNAYKLGQDQISQALENRGLGKSSFLGNSLARYWDSYGNTVAQQNQAHRNALAQYQQQALMTVLGNAMGANQSAMGGYQNIMEAGLRKQDSQNQLMGSLFNAIGTVAGTAIGGGFGGGR